MPTGVRALLLDIEGTTTPISFVYEILFPFARQRLEYDNGGGLAKTAGTRFELFDYRAMSKMYAVKGAYRRYAATMMGSQVVQTANQFHANRSTW